MESKRGELLNRIDRLSHDLSADHGLELRELKSEYNRIMNDMDNVSSNVGSDILDVFPSELWIQIVKDALPARGYSSALLLLTMVSNRWMQALTSVPALWTCIDLRGSQEDSLATIEVFKQLSGDMSLKLSLYVPTRHDIALIHGILASVAPRLCEVTIRQDKDDTFFVTATWSVVSLFLRSPQHTSSVVYIHIDSPNNYLQYDPRIGRLLGDTRLPPLLRGLPRWRFLWSEFQQADNYLQNLEAIESCDPLEFVITDQIQLPRLKDIKIYRDFFPVTRLESTSHTGLPRLVNLTSLTYKNAFREALIQLLASVAPQLLSLELRIPHAKVPLLLPFLQAAICLRTLSIDVDEWRESDQRQATSNDPHVPPAIVRNVPSLRKLTLCVLPVDAKDLPRPDIAVKASLLSSLLRAIRILYPNAETLEFAIDPEYPTLTTDILGYVSGLNPLRKLRWRDDHRGVDFSKETMREMKTLEYLYTDNPGLLCCLRATNLLSLSLSWGYHGAAENLRYEHLLELCITYEDGGEPMIEPPGDRFPSLVALTLVFRTSGREDEHVYNSFKLTSFRMLSSITIESSRFGFAPHETMLCFAILCRPEECPTLNEIRFRNCVSDWDALFLLLEKRNFMADASVSRIRAITLPFIPNELRVPLAALLGDRYAERPPNEDLIMGGAREIIFDENIPGCLTCLLDMRADCWEEVRIVRKDDLPPGYDQTNAMNIKFRWQADPDHADATIVEWIKQRRTLQQTFLQSLEIWGEKYQRMSRCWIRGSEMEITEYGVRVIRSSRR